MGKWRATVVQDCKIICDMCYNSLVVVQRTRAHKGANHLATFEICATLLRVNTTLCNVVRMFVRPNATIWISKCCLWILNMFKSQKRPNATTFAHKTNAMHRTTEETGRNLRIAKFTIASCFKAVGSQLWKGYKARLNAIVNLVMTLANSVLNMCIQY